MTDWPVATLTEAIEGLRDRAQELQDYPGRLHVHEVQPRDLLGAPKLSPAFWRWLTRDDEDRYEGEHRWVHDSELISEERVCPLRHVAGVKCPICPGTGIYVTKKDVYTRPLARALTKLVSVKTDQRPHPLIVIQALLAEGFSVERAARRYGVVILSEDQRRNEEARVLSAIRALRSRYEETVLGPRPGWLERSDAQRAAENVA